MQGLGLVLALTYCAHPPKSVHQLELPMACSRSTDPLAGDVEMGDALPRSAKAFTAKSRVHPVCSCGSENWRES